ncbi:MAG: serine/threonine protein kinase, partial [Candidatus Aenigmarchaeota archaeon]|nr:serine/threonine protein kinase [Candidatus Aenigmarchaeota archaeon]
MTISTLGEYKVIKELGRGGMGVVYLAEHQRLLKKYALKILPQAFSEDPQLVERFHNEARVMAEL